MKRLLALSIVFMLVLAGCRGSGISTGPFGDDEADQRVSQNVVPPGTDMTVRINERLSTETTDVGEEFTATVVEPITTPAGAVAVPTGAVVYGEVTGLDESDRVGEQAAIRLNFTSIEVGNEYYELDADVEETDLETNREGDIVGEETAIGAAAGAALGAIMTGDLLDTVIGGALGAGAGTAISLGTGEVDTALPENTAMVLETQERIVLA